MFTLQRWKILISCSFSLLLSFFIFCERRTSQIYSCVKRKRVKAFILYFLQVYPTATRALGLGTSSGMARVGALITPFVAQVTPWIWAKREPFDTKLLWFNPLNLTCRWCWSPLCTWRSLCTAAAASLPPSPPALCPSRPRGGVCRSPAIASGDRRWSATVQEGSLAPAQAPDPRAEGEHRTRRKKQKQTKKKAEADFYFYLAFVCVFFCLDTAVASESDSTVLLQHCVYRWGVFATV